MTDRTETPARSGSSGARSWFRIFGSRASIKIPGTSTRASDTQSSALTRAIPGATFRISRDGTYLGYTPGDGFKTIVPPEDFLGRRVDHVLPPEVASQITRLIEFALETGRLQQLEYQVKLDGEIRHFEARIVPEDPDTVFAVVRDVTDRRRAVDALEASERRYRTLYENIPVMYFTLTTDGHVQSVNAAGAEQLGYAQEELVGEPVLNVFHVDDRSAVQQQLAQAVQRPGEVARWEFRKVRKNGTVIWVRESVTTVKDRDGENVVLVVCEDVTEQKKIQQELAEHRMQLERLSSQLGITQERERRAIARELHDGVGQVLGLIRGKLGQLSALESARGMPLPDVCSLLDHAITQMRSLTLELSSPVLQELGLAAAIETLGEQRARVGGFQFHFESEGPVDREPEDTGFVLFRSARELLTNIVKHAGAQHVWASLQKSPAGITLTVEDDGCGFDPGDVTRRVSNEGTFGLFSIRQQMGHVGGRFEIESTSGRGTRALVSVPVSEQIPEQLESGL